MGHLIGLQTNYKLTILDNLKIKEHMPRFSHEVKYFQYFQYYHLIPFQSCNTVPFPTQWLYAGLWLSGWFVMGEEIQVMWKLYKYCHPLQLLAQQSTKYSK